MKYALLLTTALCLSVPAFAQTAPTTTPTATTPAATIPAVGSPTLASGAAPANASAVANTPLTMRGMNGVPFDWIAAWPTVLQQFPSMTAIRVNSGANTGTGAPDTMADLTTVVTNYTGKGVVVEIEDHTGTPDNVAWYTQLAQAFKGNPLVYLEMPNEPVADAQTTANNQIAIIKAIRAAGFTNWIGIQPVGGYDFSNVPMVTAALGTQNMFITPHIYYNGTDPNGAAEYVADVIQRSQAIGMIPVIDEFGNAEDGVTMDPQGNSVLMAVIAATEGTNGGTVQAGGLFWALDNGNHPDGTDSACMQEACTDLTPVGQNPLQPWLSNGTTPPVVANAAQMPAIASLDQQAGALQAANDATEGQLANAAGTAAPAASGTTPAATGATPTATGAVPTTVAGAEQEATQEAQAAGLNVTFQTPAQVEQSIETELAPFGIVATFSPVAGSTTPNVATTAPQTVSAAPSVVTTAPQTASTTPITATTGAQTSTTQTATNGNPPVTTTTTSSNGSPPVTTTTPAVATPTASPTLAQEQTLLTGDQAADAALKAQIAATEAEIATLTNTNP